MAAAVTMVGALLFISATDAEARSRKRYRPAGGWQAGFSAIVIDAKTGKTLDEESPDALRHPASLTKIMTLYLLFERIEQGKLTLKSRLNVSEFASERPPSKLGLKPGTTIAAEDAIKALVTRSANDVATVIAENLADDEEAFAALMTRKARALGMSNTVFKNASGLPDREQVTTARDMATLGRAVQDRFPALYRYFSTHSFVWRGRVIANHNRLLGRVQGVDGIKTGYTNASGFNLVTNVRHKNRHVVAVVLGGRTGAQRDQYMRELIADNLDDASAGPRTAPLVVEAPAPAPRPQRVAQAPAPQAKAPAAKNAKNAKDAKNARNTKSETVEQNDEKADEQVADQKLEEPKTKTVRAAQIRSQPKAQPVVVAGSNQPIRPIPVKTLALDAEGNVRDQKTAQADVFTYANLSASNVPAVAIVPLSPEQQPVVVADAPLQAQRQAQAPSPAQAPAIAPAPVTARASVASAALAYNATSPHPLAESPRLQANNPAPKPLNELSETDELELEAQAIAAERKENALAPVAPQNKPRGPQVASTTGSIPAVAAPAAEDNGDPVPAAAKTGWSIQIGAFPNAKAARERLQDVRESATALLAKVTPYTEKVSKDSTNLFRARFAGFRSEWHARRVCQTLQQRDVDCIVAKN